MKKEMPCRVTDDPYWDYDYHLEQSKPTPKTDAMEEAKNVREENADK
tara:strand:+ start:1428 stop:1568 length:141 start_codon:yes stop_codon:yes gene_type:complete